MLTQRQKQEIKAIRASLQEDVARAKADMVHAQSKGATTRMNQARDAWIQAKAAVKATDIIAKRL